MCCRSHSDQEGNRDSNLSSGAQRGQGGAPSPPHSLGEQDRGSPSWGGAVASSGPNDPPDSQHAPRLPVRGATAAGGLSFPAVASPWLSWVLLGRDHRVSTSPWVPHMAQGCQVHKETSGPAPAAAAPALPPLRTFLCPSKQKAPSARRPPKPPPATSTTLWPQEQWEVQAPRFREAGGGCGQ